MTFKAISVLHVIADLSAGGAETALKRLVTAHREGPSRFRHHVISLHELGRIGGELQAHGVQVESLGMRGPTDTPRILLQLMSRIRRKRPTLVHGWMYHGNLLGGLAARLVGGPKIIWAIRATSFDATLGVSRLTTWLRRVSAFVSGQIPDVIVYVAEASRKEHEAIGYSSSHSLVIPNGFPPVSLITRAAARRALSIAPDPLLIGSVGRFNAAKDVPTFVEAAALLKQQLPGLRFMMVGRGFVDDNSELSELLGRHGLRNSFLLLGERTDVDLCLEAMNIFCLHSVTEAFPNVLAEAMNVGLPCVATDVGDAAQIVGGAGKIVRPRDPRALAKALAELVGLGEDGRAALGAEARARIQAEYSLAAIVTQYEELYRKLAVPASSVGK